MSRARFHEQHPELVNINLTADQAETALCVMDAALNGKCDGHKDLYDWFNCDQGSAATRLEFLVAGIVLDRAWEQINEHFPDSTAGDEVMEAIGCWDFDWIPTMLSAWCNDPDVDFAKYTIEQIERHKASREKLKELSEEQIVRHIANRFSAQINDWLTSDEMIKVNSDEKDPTTGLKLHNVDDFCDPNQAMINAYEAVTGLEWDGRDSRCTERCEKAWDEATKAFFMAIDEPF